MVDENRSYLLERHVPALKERVGHFDRILGHFDRIKGHASILEERVGHFNRIERHAAALEQRVGHFDRMGRHAAALLEERVGHFDRIGRHTAADMESLMKFEQDRLKRLNFLSETQASLGFPNIIRGELAVDPFRISTPTQRRTPLFDLPPTSSTSEVYEEIPPEIIPAPSSELVPITNHEKVFIVHGHDHASRDTVADFVNNWDLIPTVLDEQPSGSRTIIEKFEQCADEADFVIVLMTPDDVGASKKNRGDLKYRARQNVIFELAYFFGSKGRKRVCILYKEGVELPSDIHGVVYVPMDDEGEWQKRVIREMMDSDILIEKDKV